MTNEQTLAEAIMLLDDENLVWDADFELIRHWLSSLFKTETHQKITSPQSVEIAKILISTTKH
jgi:hypothetical protein